MKKNFQKIFSFIAIMAITPFITVNAKNGETFGTKGATISGTNYEINSTDKKIVLDANANVVLSGDAEDYFIDIKNNAKNVTITLNNYKAATGGWINAINLTDGSSVKIILVGDNSLKSGSEASAIRVPEGTSLIIEGNGKLTATIDNGGSAALSAVIGSGYDNNCGDITINGGVIKTDVTERPDSSGIGSGSWHFNSENIKGKVTINGGIIETSVIGSRKYGSDIKISGSGNAIINLELLGGNLNNFNGIILNRIDNEAKVIGNATLTSDLTISSEYTTTIESTASLTIAKGVTLTNKGAMLNEGNIMNKGTLKNEGTLNNTGRLNSNAEIENVSGNTVYPASYNYIDSSKFVYTKGKDKEAVFKIDANYNLFIDGGKVFVNDKMLTSEDYTSEPGSTIITLSKQFMSSLSNGNYTLKVVFNNGATSETIFTVTEPVVVNPNTYDNIITYISLLGLSIIGLGLHIRLKNSL